MFGKQKTNEPTGEVVPFEPDATPLEPCKPEPIDERRISEQLHDQHKQQMEQLTEHRDHLVDALERTRKRASEIEADLEETESCISAMRPAVDKVRALAERPEAVQHFHKTVESLRTEADKMKTGREGWLGPKSDEGNGGIEAEETQAAE